MVTLEALAPVEEGAAAPHKALPTASSKRCGPEEDGESLLGPRQAWEGAEVGRQPHAGPLLFLATFKHCVESAQREPVYLPEPLLKQIRHYGQVGAKSWQISSLRPITKRPRALRGPRGPQRGPVSVAVTDDMARPWQHQYTLVALTSSWGAHLPGTD